MTTFDISENCEKNAIFQRIIDISIFKKKLSEKNQNYQQLKCYVHNLHSNEICFCDCFCWKKDESSKILFSFTLDA